jgi:hypothetical protein
MMLEYEAKCEYAEYLADRRLPRGKSATLLGLPLEVAGEEPTPYPFQHKEKPNQHPIPLKPRHRKYTK